MINRFLYILAVLVIIFGIKYAAKRALRSILTGKE